MSDNSDNIARVKVLSKTSWTPTLFSFTVTRPESFKFTAGQFVRLGVNPSRLNFHKVTNGLNNTDLNSTDISSTDVSDDQANSKFNSDNDNSAIDEDIFRAYSIVSSPYDEVLEFFSIVIPDGAFTSQLQHLQVGDELLLNTTPFGFLTLARYQEPAPKDLWLLATGTGLAPFLSMLQDLKTWENYTHIILAYSARTQSELAYVDRISRLVEDFAALVDNPASFTFVPIVTREVIKGALDKRLPELLKTGELEGFVGHQLDPNSSHVMLCGNPEMVEDTKETLKEMGLNMNRRGVGNIAVENYW